MFYGFVFFCLTPKRFKAVCEEQQLVALWVVWSALWWYLLVLTTESLSSLSLGLFSFPVPNHPLYTPKTPLYVQWADIAIEKNRIQRRGTFLTLPAVPVRKESTYKYWRNYIAIMYRYERTIKVHTCTIQKKILRINTKQYADNTESATAK